MASPTKFSGLTPRHVPQGGDGLPRPLRAQVEGGVYHLVSRGVRALPIYSDDKSRRRFLSLLDLVTSKYRWELHTYCLMTNHYHLLVTTVDPTLSAGMQYLLSCYAQWFDWREGFEGHVFERRFYSREIATDRDFLSTARYILLNPVRAGLCDTAAEWRWSSCGATAGTTTGGPALSNWDLDYFGRRKPERARERFADFIRAGEADARATRTERG
jgi:REP-associated tyrosine transposase